MSSSQHSLVMPSADHLPSRPESYPVEKARIDLMIPTNLLVLPASAALVGLVIGMSRGGSRARLRFLAENAHRPPTTIQGWYFYTKTRNYRVFFSAAKMGAKYALGLGGATAGFVLLDEGAGWVRERVVGVEAAGTLDRKGKGRAVDSTSDGGETLRMEEEKLIRGRKGWRKGAVHWEDGAVAGMVMGAGVGLLYTLPRPLFIRALVMGTLLGGATSGLQAAQDYVGRLRVEQALHEPRSATALPPPEQTAGGTGATGDVRVDRPAQVGEKMGGVPVDETRPVPGQAAAAASGGGSSWYSWIPGLGK
ncbi:uncharacterized protein MKK02DRAFT_39895 [Dioszegia hungarica]|uniref:Uncharacterized protein n=1 Tax=Dioszegia hungarica TaxID=4972 RepID=A0AA38HFI1_9TREE|nr:uncharacterized protein MKK02DRAFT_39895 [Dioszegia hungarica]KAI9639575.1 hypothetical protein MKK02DRAFT_39895 [Dioszegia hungarica]